MPVDYAALAEQARSAPPSVDYAALAEQARQPAKPYDAARRGAKAKGTPEGLPDTFMGTITKDLAAVPEGVYNAVTHPIDTVKGAIHQLANLPGDVMTDISQGNWGKLAAKFTELALPALSTEKGLAAAGKAGAAVESAAPIVAGAAKGAAQAIPHAIETSVLKYTGLPQVVRGAYKGGKAALEKRAAEMTPVAAATPIPEPVAAPPATPPAPRLPRKAKPTAQAPAPVEPAPAPVAETPAPAPKPTPQQEFIQAAKATNGKSAPIDIAKRLKASMEESGSAPVPPVEEAPSPRVAEIVEGNRAKKTADIAQKLHDAGITSERLHFVTRPQWQEIVKHEGIGYPDISETSIPQVLSKVKELEGSRPTAVQQLETVKAKLPKNGKK